MAQLEQSAGPVGRERERTVGRGEKVGAVRVGERARRRENRGEPGDSGEDVMLGKINLLVQFCYDN